VSTAIRNSGCWWPAAGTDSLGRHLHLQLQRTDLLIDPAGHRGAIRMPAWRLYDDAGQPPLPG
jgi:hypothetical protein